jgi:hypothetical protein
MNMTVIKKVKYLVFLFIVTCSLTTSLKASAETIDAQWKVYQIRFHYFPFSTFYSCDGIERKLERLLMILGARDDARVEMKCFGNEDLRRRREQRSYRLLLAFAMPVPADKTDISKETFPAEWHETRVAGNISSRLDGGDCELVEQFQRYVVPQLEVKAKSRSLHCVPMRRPSNNLRVRMTALRAIEKTELEEKSTDSSMEKIEGENN